MNTSELFDVILERPTLYVGHESIIKIKAFIDGYEYAKYTEGNDSRDPLYANFNDWIAKRFNITSMHNWASIISFMALSEIGAFELTKELWGEYKSGIEKNVDRS